MKTAISLPDDVYHEAERHAKRTRKSRSQLYTEALAEYLARPAPDEVNVSQNIAPDRSLLSERVGRVGPRQMTQILHHTDVILGR